MDPELLEPVGASVNRTLSEPNSLTLSEALAVLEADGPSTATQNGYTDCVSIWLPAEDQMVLKLGGEKVPITGPAFMESKISVRDTSGKFRAAAIVKYSIPMDQVLIKKNQMLTAAVASAIAAGHKGNLVKEKRKWVPTNWGSNKRKRQ